MARRMLFQETKKRGGNTMANETRDNQNIADEGGFEGAKYNQRAQGEVEEHHAAGSGIEGEGSYEGARDYERRLKDFVRSGRVEQAANDAEIALDSESEGDEQVGRKGKARAGKSAVSADADEEVAVHVKHERMGWVVEPGTGKGPAPIFDSIDDALRRAHELAAEQHLPLLVHGPDGELIDKYDAL
jgi:hypothetical protein